ncbi:lipopolysaccharide biosynthesis protein [Sanguibacter massiliensis]|uniref:lipopolysaccharide biosynthesis protein n=1 Tax=Sanguibacter massiliensis TaxID=1973217 RepID=UPI000C843463|nr:hypothetical protein [Sanguibacter massiliensis]
MVPAVSAFMPLISMTVIQRALGAERWAEAAIGMAVGMFGAGIVDFGYGVLGPSRVARTLDPQERAQVYATSLRIRLWVSAGVLPVLFVVAEMIGPTAGIAGAGLVAVATAIVGLAPNWYYIGAGRASGLLLADTLPRLAVTAISAVVLLFVPSLNLYGAIMVVGVAAAYTGASVMIVRGRSRVGWRLGRADRAEARRHLSLVGPALVTSVYTTLTTPIVGIVAPTQLASYGAADRLRGMIRQIETAAGNGLQSWVSEHLDDGPVTRRRMMRTVALMAGVGAVAAIGTATLMPWVQDLISGGTVRVDRATSVLAGLSLFFIAINISLVYHVLAPLKLARPIAVSALAAALVGLPVVIGLAHLYGAAGAMGGVAVAELVSGAVLAVTVRPALRRLTAPARS